MIGYCDLINNRHKRTRTHTCIHRVVSCVYLIINLTTLTKQTHTKQQTVNSLIKINTVSNIITDTLANNTNKAAVLCSQYTNLNVAAVNRMS